MKTYEPATMTCCAIYGWCIAKECFWSAVACMVAWIVLRHIARHRERNP